MPQNHLKHAGAVVSALFTAIQGSSISLDSVPGLLKRVIKEGLWQEQELPRSHIVEKYSSFAEFAEKGLNGSVESLKKLCRDDTEALDLIDRVTTAPQGRRTKVYTVNLCSPPTKGNANTYALRKLRKARPDLHTRVLAGELSPHGAMVEGGYRPKQITIVINPERTARAIRRHFSEEQTRQLVSLLSSNSNKDG